MDYCGDTILRPRLSLKTICLLLFGGLFFRLLVEDSKTQRRFPSDDLENGTAPSLKKDRKI